METKGIVLLVVVLFLSSAWLWIMKGYYEFKP
jgi:hypothetical protein